MATGRWTIERLHRICLTQSEEFERREVLNGEKLAAAKYAWQPIPSEVQQIRSGRFPG
jgi:hypothetical protein